MDVSNREKSIWIELFVSIGVAIYYFANVFSAGGFNDIISAEVGKVIINAILISIAASIILSIIFKQKDPEAKDERDKAIEARANAYAYYALTFLIVSIIIHIMINEGAGYFFNEDVLRVSNAQTMHFILIALIIAGAVKSVTQLFCYRRGLS